MKNIKNNKQASEFLVKGDKLLANENLSEALENYNNCLRFAESESIERQLGFSARAKVFYRLNLFRECNENIKLAKSNVNVIDDVFDQELRDIEERVKNAVDSDESANKWNFFKLSHDANQKIPFIANCLEVRQNEFYGRFIATNRDLNPGDIVIVEEPFYKVISPLEVNLRCSICLKQNSQNLLPCSTCPTGS